MLVRRYTPVAFKFVLLRHVQDEGTENKGLMMKHCMICGQWNEDDDKFCTGCGSSLTQSEVSIPQPSGEKRTFAYVLRAVLSMNCHHGFAPRAANRLTPIRVL